jgi:hypothetical protein
MISLLLSPKSKTAIYTDGPLDFFWRVLRLIRIETMKQTTKTMSLTVVPKIRRISSIKPMTIANAMTRAIMPEKVYPKMDFGDGESDDFSSVMACSISNSLGSINERRD